MKVYGSVYLITNRVNGKQYVGATKCGVKRRFSQHLADATIPRKRKVLHCAINKYGKDNFDVTVVAECLDKSSLFQAERTLIKAYNTLTAGYNLTSGGEGGQDYEWTAGQKSMLSKKYSGGKHPQCRFTKQDLLKIKGELKHHTILEVAETNNCSRETIRGLIAGRTYKDIGIDFTGCRNKDKTFSKHRYVYYDSHKGGQFLVMINKKYYGKYKTEANALDRINSILNKVV